MKRTRDDSQPAALFAWDEAMTVAFGVLRLAPDHFWAMTPREFAAATGARLRQHAAIGRQQFENLANRYPDTCEEK